MCVLVQYWHEKGVVYSLWRLNWKYGACNKKINAIKNNCNKNKNAKKIKMQKKLTTLDKEVSDKDTFIHVDKTPWLLWRNYCIVIALTSKLCSCLGIEAKKVSAYGVLCSCWHAASITCVLSPGSQVSASMDGFLQHSWMDGFWAMVKPCLRSTCRWLLSINYVSPSALSMCPGHHQEGCQHDEWRVHSTRKAWACSAWSHSRDVHQWARDEVSEPKAGWSFLRPWVLIANKSGGTRRNSDHHERCLLCKGKALAHRSHVWRSIASDLKLLDLGNVCDDEWKCEKV